MEPKASDVFLNAIHSVLDNCHFCLPGVFTAYDFNTKKASVQPGILKILNDGKQTQLQLPIITDVPVQWPGTVNGILHFEITPNKDTCLIIFSERSLENWLSSNGQNPVIPGDPRQFSLTDAIAIPGLFPFTNPGKVGAGKGMELLWNKAGLTIDDSNLIKIGNDQTDMNTLLTGIYTGLQKIYTILNDLITPANMSNGGGPVILATAVADAVAAAQLNTQITQLNTAIGQLLQPSSEAL